MFRIFRLLRCPNQPTLSGPTAKTLITAVERVVPETYTAIRTLSSQLPDDVQESIIENHGSLLRFLQQTASSFDVKQQTDGVWMARCAKSQHNPPPRPRKPISSIVEVRVSSPLWQWAGWSPTLASTSPEAVNNCLQRLVQLMNHHDVYVTQHPLSGDLWLGIGSRQGASMEEKSVKDAAGEKTLVHDYDVLRLARHLDKTSHRSVIDLEASSSDVLSMPLFAVALSMPTHFEVEKAGVDVALLQDPYIEVGTFPTTDPSDDSADRMRSDSRLLGLFNANVCEALVSRFPAQRHVSRVTGIRYSGQVSMGRSDKLSQMSDTELEAELQSAKETLKKKRGLKYAAARRQIQRERLWRRFPNGSPFFDENVVAMYLFDLMQDLPPRLPHAEALKLLEASNKPCVPMHGGAFSKFSHLFVIDEPFPGQMYLTRRDDLILKSEKMQSAIRVLSASDAGLEFSMQLVSATASQQDPVVIHAHTAQLCLRRATRDALYTHYGGGLAFFEGHPDTFTRKEGDAIYQTTHEKLRLLVKKIMEMNSVSR